MIGNPIHRNIVVILKHELESQLHTTRCLCDSPFRDNWWFVLLKLLAVISLTHTVSLISIPQIANIHNWSSAHRNLRKWATTRACIRLNRNQGPLNSFPGLRIFLVTLHFPCTYKLYLGNMCLQNGSKYLTKLGGSGHTWWRYYILKYQNAPKQR